MIMAVTLVTMFVTPFVSGATTPVYRYLRSRRPDEPVQTINIKHDELHDWFCIVKGAAKFVLVDDRPNSPTHQEFDILVGSDRSPSLIVVPPGIYHGWMSLQPDTIMVSTASHEYNREKPDEARIPPESFNELIGEDPWLIKGK